jgi:mono/diheme cytochrome c family protein
MKIRLGNRLAAVIAGGFLLAAVLAAGELAQSAAPAPGPLVWDRMSQEYNAKPGQTTNVFTFSVTNASPFPVEINQMKASCLCTVAKMPHTPWRLEPGAGGHAYATINFAGKYGEVKKSIVVSGSQITPTGAIRFSQDLSLKVTIPIPPNIPGATNTSSGPVGGMHDQANMDLARLDRQAVFKGECAGCHAKPAEGKMGEELFHAVCGICHESPRRASMVPDLAVAKAPRTALYWTAWTKFGKGGTLMPGFSNSKPVAGPLTPAQIQSLVAFLQKKYPSTSAPLK